MMKLIVLASIFALIRLVVFACSATKKSKTMHGSNPTAEKIAAKYVETILARHGLSFVNPKKANRYFDQIVKLYFELRLLGEEGWQALETLRNHEHPAVRLWAALDTHSRNPQATLAVLEALSRSEPPGEVYGNATRCLEQIRAGTFTDATEWPDYRDLWNSLESAQRTAS